MSTGARQHGWCYHCDMKFEIRPQKATFSTENIYIKKKKSAFRSWCTKILKAWLSRWWHLKTKTWVCSMTNFDPINSNKARVYFNQNISHNFFCIHIMLFPAALATGTKSKTDSVSEMLHLSADVLSCLWFCGLLSCWIRVCNRCFRSMKT